MWGAMTPAARERLQAVNRRAVEATIRLIESRFAFSRAGKASEGCQYIPVGLVIALFEHASSRAKDPDLHIHAQILNLGVDQDGQVRSLESLAIFQNQAILTNYYRAQLAAGLRAEFGLVTEVTETGFTIQGVPPELSNTPSGGRPSSPI
jgi:conjugative relaxase-like TrwC/TraI family protein